MKILSAVALAMALVTGSAQAVLVPNGSFENGLNDWNTSGNVSIQTSYRANDAGTPVIMYPTDGNYLAAITAGSFTSSLTSNPFAVFAGQNLVFDWFFDAVDYLPYNDFVSYVIKIIGGGVVDSGVLADVAGVGNYGLTGWNTFSYTLPVSGQAVLVLSATNYWDTAFPSVLGIDNVRLIPEPAPVALVGLGLLGLAGLRRKRVVT